MEQNTGKKAVLLLVSVAATLYLSGFGNGVSKAYAKTGKQNEAQAVYGNAAPRQADVAAKAAAAGQLSTETYNALLEDLLQVGKRKNRDNYKLKGDGEIRYHYAANSGPRWTGRDTSGLRTDLGLEMAFAKDWQVIGMIESKTSFLNYENLLEFSRISLAGKLGDAKLRVGSFGYLMGDGNIYDSGFKGLRVERGEPFKYTLAYGETNDTKDTFVSTLQYKTYDYDLEAGLYRYRLADGDRSDNTLWTLGGKYHFSNFSVGAMMLGADRRRGDKNGYVLSLDYGELKAYRAGTYSVFAKYYDQPKDTYIAHGMNGQAGALDGFEGCGVGVKYAVAENLVVGVEYYDLADKGSGARSNTWWNQLTYYF